MNQLSIAVHKKIVEKALGYLDADRAVYFGAIANKLEQDIRIENNANLVFTVLKDIMAELPIYLEHDDLINLLLEFTDRNYQQLKDILYDPKFIRDPSLMRSVTGAFVHQVVMISLEKHDNGEISETPLSVHKYTWPYRDTDVVDPEDDPEAWGEAIAKSEKWRLENDGIDRRRSGVARIDDIASGIADEREKKKAPKGPKDLKITDL